MLKRCVLWALLGIALAPLAAAAQGRPIGLAERKGGRDHAVELEFDFSRDTVDRASPTSPEITFTTLLPKLYGSFGLSKDLELEAQLTTIYADVSVDEGPGGDSTFELANPYAALFYAKRSDRSVARVGFGVALPLLDVEGFAALQIMGMGTRGFRDTWLYAHKALSFVVPVQLQVRATMLVLGLDAALAAMVLTDDGTDDDDDVEVPLQAGALVGAALGDITLGLRLQLGTILTTDGDDTQVSAMPFIQADLDGGGFIHGGILVNLDDPFGVLGDDGGYELWALRVGGGTRF